MAKLKIEIPEGVVPGQTVAAAIPEGGYVNVNIPAGLGPGDVFYLRKESEESEKWQVEVPNNLRIAPAPPLRPVAAPGVRNDVLVVLETSAGPIEIMVKSDWAPNGAKRFLELVDAGHFEDLRIYRAVQGCLLQIGLPAKRVWTPIPDDQSIGVPFKRGVVCLVGNGVSSRTSDVVVCLNDLSHTLGQNPWNTPIGHVTDKSLAKLDGVVYKYGDIAECGGTGPEARRAGVEGNAYLDKHFPDLTRIFRAHCPHRLSLTQQAKSATAKKVPKAKATNGILPAERSKMNQNAMPPKESSDSQGIFAERTILKLAERSEDMEVAHWLRQNEPELFQQYLGRARMAQIFASLIPQDERQSSERVPNSSASSASDLKMPQPPGRYEQNAENLGQRAPQGLEHLPSPVREPERDVLRRQNNKMLPLGDQAHMDLARQQGHLLQQASSARREQPAPAPPGFPPPPGMPGMPAMQRAKRPHPQHLNRPEQERNVVRRLDPNRGLAVDGSDAQPILTMLPSTVLAQIFDALKHQFVLQTISQVCRKANAATIHHCLARRPPMCASFSGSFEPMDAPLLKVRMAMPRWAQCNSVVLLIKDLLKEKSPISAVDYPKVKSLTIKASGRASLPTTVLKKVLHNFPNLESLTLNGISQVSKTKILAISHIKPHLLKIVLDNCSAAADQPMILSGEHFEHFCRLRTLSISNYSGAVAFEGIPFWRAPQTLEEIRFVEGPKSQPRGAQQWFVQNLEAARQHRRFNVRMLLE